MMDADFRAGEMKFGSGYLYFAVPIGQDGPVKIGFSAMPEKRLLSLMTWSPFKLEILATVPGSFKLERKVHRCFADQHSHHEWFHASKRLSDAIKAIRAGTPIEEAINFNDVRGDIRIGGKPGPKKGSRHGLSVKGAYTLRKLKEAAEQGLSGEDAAAMARIAPSTAKKYVLKHALSLQFSKLQKTSKQCRTEPAQ